MSAKESYLMEPGVMINVKEEDTCDDGGGVSSRTSAKHSDVLSGAIGAGMTSADLVDSGADVLGSDLVGPGGVDIDSGLLPLPGVVWGYPKGCPVAFNFRLPLLGPGDVDFQCGAVTEVLMDPSTRKLIVFVEQCGQIKIIHEDNIGYAAGCPVTIRMAGQSISGKILFAMPNFGSTGKVESISYTAVLILDRSSRRIVSNVPANLIRYREAGGDDVNSFSSEEKQSEEGTQSQSKPVLLPAARAKTDKRKKRTLVGLTKRVKHRKEGYDVILNKEKRSAEEAGKIQANLKPRSKLAAPPPAPRADTHKRQKISDSNIDGFTELRVGSRVDVLLNGSKWQATIVGDKDKRGERGLLVHYKGLKAKSRHWVSVDQVVSLISNDM